MKKAKKKLNPKQIELTSFITAQGGQSRLGKDPYLPPTNAGVFTVNEEYPAVRLPTPAVMVIIIVHAILAARRKMKIPIYNQ